MTRRLALAIVLVVTAIGIAGYVLLFRSVEPKPAPTTVVVVHDAMVGDAPPDADQVAGACAGGALGACRRRAEALVAANAGATSLMEADALFDKACTGGDDEACRGWAALHDRFLIVDLDKNQKLRAYDVGCSKLQDGTSCTSYAYAADAHGLRTRDVIIGLFLRGCDLGDGVGCMAAAQGNYDAELKTAKRTVKDLSARGIELLEAACKAGGSRPCNRLGYQYDAGKAVVRDRARARELYLRACEIDKAAANDCRAVDDLDKVLEQDVIKILPKKIDESAVRKIVARDRAAILRECERDGRRLADCKVIKTVAAELGRI